jgi:CheY-like chemotaxis protein
MPIRPHQAAGILRPAASRQESLTQSEAEVGVAKPHPVPERPITVLVAEDEDLLRRLVIRLLADEGYRTLEARDGAEALHLAHLSPHLALVVTDVVMPGMDGWELGRRLAVDCPAVPVLYMSAYPSADIFHRGGAPSPAIPFLQKPFARADFLTTVRELLERPGTTPPPGAPRGPYAAVSPPQIPSRT